jgi:hypothetical protein
MKNESHNKICLWFSKPEPLPTCCTSFTGFLPLVSGEGTRKGLNNDLTGLFGYRLLSSKFKCTYPSGREDNWNW